MTTADIDRIVGDIIRDCEELLTLAAGPDLPNGVKVLPLDVCRDDAAGANIGSGHSVAVAAGCQPGTVAVMVDVEGTLEAALADEPDRPGFGIENARLLAEVIALHEIAHALVARPDAERGVAEAVAWVKAVKSQPARGDAGVHHPRWAAAFVVLVARADRIRPAGRPSRWSLTVSELARGYGIDAVAVADALGDVADEVPLRGLLVADGDAARRVAAVCLPEPERQVAINEHRRQRGAANVAGIS